VPGASPRSIAPLHSKKGPQVPVTPGDIFYILLSLAVAWWAYNTLRQYF